jgi:type II restriction enzyme
MNQKLTASNIVKAISKLPKGVRFNYLSSSATQVEIESITSPEGPVKIKRRTVGKNGDSTVKSESISAAMIWRIANSFSPKVPINFERVLGASYNTRSSLEALMAHTPDFYVSYPGRAEDLGGSRSIKRGHKHLIWLPDTPHKNGVIAQHSTNLVVSEIPSVSAIYDALVIPEKPGAGLDIAIQRRHAQIQIALLRIGQQLGYRTHIAKNDHAIQYDNKRLGEMDGVVADLAREKLISNYEEAVKAAQLIDCVWFKNGKLMPAVIEVEQSTGVLSGLTRMQNFKKALPEFPTRWVIAAPDEDRDKVLTLASRAQFSDLEAKYFPYSAIEELYSLCQRRKIKGVGEEFLDCFMERVN